MHGIPHVGEEFLNLIGFEGPAHGQGGPQAIGLPFHQEPVVLAPLEGVTVEENGDHSSFTVEVHAVVKMIRTNGDRIMLGVKDNVLMAVIKKSDFQAHGY